MLICSRLPSQPDNSSGWIPVKDQPCLVALQLSDLLWSTEETPAQDPAFQSERQQHVLIPSK